MGDSVGRLVELEISNVAHGGVMVARLDGRVVFVADAIPGEVVQARISDDSREKFWRADTIAVLQASEHRQPHVWSAAGVDRNPEDRAGGAEFGHIAIDHQRELKRRVLADALQRMAGIESDVRVEALPGKADGTGWRTRFQLHVADDGTVGPYAARSHRIVPVTDFPLATAAAAAIAPFGERFPGAERVEVVAPSEGNAWVLSRERGGAPIRERVGERIFRLDVRGFWQVHERAPETLTAAVQQAIDPDRFDPDAENLDLYGGVGLLAAAVGDRFGDIRITTVESDAAATRFAAQNLAEWGRAEAVTARVERFLAAPDAGHRGVGGSASRRQRPGSRGAAGATIVLDPPRSGAGRAVVERVADRAPAQVVYVACDPVALARDVALFAGRGYRLAGLRAFDLFPNTHHVEAVAALVPA